jgi:hypothetical protein
VLVSGPIIMARMLHVEKAAAARHLTRDLPCMDLREADGAVRYG